MVNTLITISTFKKNEACEQLIESLLNNNYKERIVITDDSDNFNALPVYNRFRKEAEITYLGGSVNAGISLNKNRGIKYFLEHSQYNNMLSLDDDLLITKSGLIDHLDMICKEDDLQFTTGFWTDKVFKGELKQLWGTGGWSDQFPVKAESAWNTWHGGCHGCLVFYRRTAIEKVGYFNKLSLKYGFEHSLYCSRILRAFGLCPELFPIMKFSRTWFHGNDIPNNYEIDVSKVFEINGAEHSRLLLKVYEGKGLTIEDHGLKKILKKDRKLES